MQEVKTTAHIADGNTACHNAVRHLALVGVISVIQIGRVADVPKRSRAGDAGVAALLGAIDAISIIRPGIATN